MELNFIQKVSVWALPVLFAISVHEVAHGWVASMRGDQTARLAGRLSLNPIKHIDMVGTIIVPMLLLWVGNFIFGWAKPVPVDSRNLKNPRVDMAIVAAAGPIANILMALFWAAVAKLGFIFFDNGSWIAVPIIYMGQAGIMINCILAVLNLLPIPPLDGGRALYSLLPPRISWQLSQYEIFGFIILIILILTGILSAVLAPLVFGLIRVISTVFGLI